MAKKGMIDGSALARDLALNEARVEGGRAGFERGWEASKLDAFRYMALKGAEFGVTPGVARFLLPLAEERLRNLGVHVPITKEDA